MAKQKNTLITSPFGTALWAAIVEPDTKFNELGDYKINLRVPEAEAQALMDQILAEKEKALEMFKEEARAAGKLPKAIEKIKLSEQNPFEEDEEEEGVIVFKFKRKASYIKDGGELVHFTVGLVDATGKTIPEKSKPNVGNGSVVRVMAELVPYNMATTGVGISLRLMKVQIKELVEYSTDGPGFDAVEDGGYVPEGMDQDFDSAGDSGYTV